MPYHVMIWPTDTRQQASGELYGFNLNEERLRDRFIDPYNAGTPITYGGRTVEGIDSIQIGFTEEDVGDPGGTGDRFEVFRRAQDVTNEWITGPQGRAASAPHSAEAASGHALDPRQVMVVYGRNETSRVAMFHFLRALGLQPIEWEAAIRATGMGSPHNLDAVRAAMSCAQAVVVLLTAEDRAGLLPELAEASDEDDVALRGQPRQNVILEAGLAMGVGPERTILVELGPIRRASDFEGLNAVRLSNTPATRTALRSRLEGAGCDVDAIGADWLSPESGGDFEDSVISWEAAEPPSGEKSPTEREARARPAAGTVPRSAYQQARQLEWDHKLRRFLDQRREIDQPFSEMDLVAHMSERKLDEVAAARLFRSLHEQGVIYPNPDGGGWYPSAED